MPYVHNEGADLFWDARGAGEPVLMIMGLSFTHEMWFRILPALAPRYRAILFDNRGVGRSSVPDGPYSIAQMARDADAVLRAAGESSAHVIGASMGGMIAQELALRKPTAVRSLVLGCTSHSGLVTRWPDFKALPAFRGLSKLDRAGRERALARLLYANTTPSERVEEDIRVRARTNWAVKGFRNQFAAILLWSAYCRLPRISVPALVVHGDQDRFVPAGNGRVVARRIPNARFELIPDAGHILTTDQPELCARLMLEFLDGQQNSQERQLAAKAAS